MPIATNRVTLHPTERDQHGLPIPRLNLDDHPNDLAMKRHAYRNGIAMLEAAGALRVFCSPPLPVSHNLGTCRMSEDPDAGVVDRWGRSHEIPNLFISTAASSRRRWRAIPRSPSSPSLSARRAISPDR